MCCCVPIRIIIVVSHSHILTYSLQLVELSYLTSILNWLSACLVLARLASTSYVCLCVYVWVSGCVQWHSHIEFMCFCVCFALWKMILNFESEQRKCFGKCISIGFIIVSIQCFELYKMKKKIELNILAGMCVFDLLSVFSSFGRTNNTIVVSVYNRDARICRSP